MLPLLVPPPREQERLAEEERRVVAVRARKAAQQAARRAAKREAEAMEGTSQAPNGRKEGKAAVGRRIEVFWPEDDTWYGGRVAAFNATSGEHKIRYDDGDVELVTLGTERFRWGCLLYTSPSPRDRQKTRMPSSA